MTHKLSILITVQLKYFSGISEGINHVVGVSGNGC